MRLWRRRHSEDDQKVIDLRLRKLLKSGLVCPSSVKTAAHCEQHKESYEVAIFFLLWSWLLSVFLFGLAGSCFALIGRGLDFRDWRFRRRFRGSDYLRVI